MADSNAKKLAQLLDGNGDVLLDNLDNVSVTPTAVSDQANTSTGGFSLPAGTTAQRPGTPDTGETRFNSTTGSVEFYDGTAWIGGRKHTQLAEYLPDKAFKDTEFEDIDFLVIGWKK